MRSNVKGFGQTATVKPQAGIRRNGLGRKILGDPCVRTVFLTAGQKEIYLVGGYLRDLLIGRQSFDRDFVMARPIEQVVSLIASKSSSGVIRLGKEGLLRIVPGKGRSFDFSPMVENIETDISRRDFTVNALAWSPTSGIIDMHNGMSDISDRIIRMVGIDNIRKDPVRILRAYRIAGELFFRVEPNTRKAMKSLSGFIASSKSERITLEFFKILNLQDPRKVLRAMGHDGVLQQVICINPEELASRLKELSQVTKTIEKLPLKYYSKVHESFSQDLSRKGLAMLAALLHGSGRHRLTFSSAIRRMLFLIGRGIELVAGRRFLSKEELFDVFSISEAAAIEVLVAGSLVKYIPEHEKYISIMKEHILPVERMMKITGLREGRPLGLLMAELKRARFTGKVCTSDDAAEFLGQVASQGELSNPAPRVL